MRHTAAAGCSGTEEGLGLAVAAAAAVAVAAAVHPSSPCGF